MKINIWSVISSSCETAETPPPHKKNCFGGVSLLFHAVAVSIPKQFLNMIVYWLINRCWIPNKGRGFPSPYLQIAVEPNSVDTEVFSPHRNLQRLEVDIFA